MVNQLDVERTAGSCGEFVQGPTISDLAQIHALRRGQRP
jgi:hypothetical protein